MNEFCFSDLQIGMTVSFQREITAEMEDLFRIISGDDNPMHKDDGFAKETSNGKFRSHVSFGMLTASLYSALAGMYLPGKYSLIHSFDGISFQNPVFAGDRLMIEGEIADKQDDLKLIIIKAAIRNQNNKIVSRAKLKVLVLR